MRLLLPAELIFFGAEVSLDQLVDAAAHVAKTPVSKVYADFRDSEFHLGDPHAADSKFMTKMYLALWLLNLSPQVFYQTLLFLLTRVDRWDVSTAVINEIGQVPSVALDHFRKTQEFLVMPDCLASKYTAKELCLMLNTLGDNSSYHCDSMNKAEACRRIVQLLHLTTNDRGQVVTTRQTDPQLVLSLKKVFNVHLVDNVYAIEHDSKKGVRQQEPQVVQDIYVLSFAKLNMVSYKLVKWLRSVVKDPEYIDKTTNELFHQIDNYAAALTSFLDQPSMTGPRVQYYIDMNQVKYWARELDHNREARDFPKRYMEIPLPPIEELERQLQGLFDHKTNIDMHRIRNNMFYDSGAIPLDDLRQETPGMRVRRMAHDTLGKYGDLNAKLGALRDKSWYHDRNKSRAVKLRGLVEQVHERRKNIQERADKYLKSDAGVSPSMTLVDQDE